MSVKFQPGGLAEPDRPVGMLPGRRRLLRGGLGAGSVLMTLASRPVSAAQCLAGSVAAGSAASGNQLQASVCSGLSPGSWFAISGSSSSSTTGGSALFISSTTTISTTAGSSWPIAPSTKFSDAFSPDLGKNNLTLKDVLDPQQAILPIARHIVAGLLNTSTAPPRVPATVLTPQRVKEIWTSVATKGFFEPTAGVRWNEAQIIAWLETTYG